MRPTGFYIWSFNAPTSDRLLGSEICIYRNKQNVIAIAAVRPNVILGQHSLFSPQVEPSVLFLTNYTLS
jgi:hypothetical protein